MGISINELLQMSNVNIIDLRDNFSYNMGHIIGSRNITYELLSQMHYNYLDKTKIYYFYCSEGKKSKVLAQKLNLLGYQCVNVNEGYNYFKNML